MCFTKVFLTLFFFLFFFYSFVYSHNILCVSIFPCANPILGDYKPFSILANELANSGNNIEFILFDDYISWINTSSNIHVRSAGKCPWTKKQEEDFFKDFSNKDYSETVEPIVNYFRTYSKTLLKNIWNDKDKIEKDLGGKIDTILLGDVFMLPTTIAEHFNTSFIKFHPGNLFEGSLNSIEGLSIKPSQVDSSLFHTKSLPLPLLLKRVLNYFFSYFIDYSIAKDTFNFENTFRKEMGMNTISNYNNFLYNNEDNYIKDHCNLYPIANIVANSPGFVPAAEVPPFVYFIGPILSKKQSIYNIAVSESIKYPDLSDIISWLDSDSRPVILLSLSTVAHFSEEGMNAIISGLGSLHDSVRVLWVIRDAARRSLPNNVEIPSNFMLSKFIPQSNTLGHNKIKIFFGVGGINSLLEAITHEKPILCCGSHFEQHYNCDRIQDLKIGYSLHKNHLLSDDIRNKSLYLLNHPEEFIPTLQELKVILESNNNAKKGVEIIERAITIGSNKYMLPRSVFMNWYSRNNFDVIMVFMSIIFTFIIVCVYILSCLLLGRKKKIKKE